MKNLIRICILLYTTLQLLSCNRKEKRITLDKIISTTITDYKHTDKYDSKIAISDSLLVIYNYGITHSSFNPTDSIVLYYDKGVKQRTNLPFNQIVVKNNLKSNNVKFLFTKDSDYDTTDISKNSLHSIAKRTSKNFTVEYLNSDGNDYLRIYKDGYNNIIKVKHYVNNIFPPKIELYDVTGDGIEEVFIFNPEFSYWDGIDYKLDIYKVDFIE
ncbi:hypothetical protein CHU92_01505 [Flavobacterium cyanobacteriorum]|uniref:Uncharacterized protein n=1 Tax=Flavobacterium cyanobacteriorum TaxID=2022802 RepID=A0A255ZYA4_9FLAO|nr:hypothetical protein [Flavobacterium cyanobacteriorum]OYQ46369.1 hypothetical protein CHU92_01505 [Flavobacterium cyanobacteriorum]